jgi:hypothetical protein
MKTLNPNEMLQHFTTKLFCDAVGRCEKPVVSIKYNENEATITTEEGQVFTIKVEIK